MAVRFNPFTGTFDFVSDLSGYVPYTGATATLNLGTRDLQMPSGTIKDAGGFSVINPNNQALYTAAGIPNVQWGTYDLADSTNTVVLNWVGPEITVSANIQMPSYDIYSNAFRGNQIVNTFGQPLIDMNGFAYYDGSTVAAINMNSRQLLDSGGSYVSIDWGTYGLYNIGISNSVPLLDWSTGAGGSVKIYDGYNNSVVGDFTNRQLFLTGTLTLDWGSRQLYDNFSSTSIDWDYHYLMYLGVVSLDWQNLLCNNSAGATTIDWGNSKLINTTDNFTAVDWFNYKLYDASPGDVISIDWLSRYLYNPSGSVLLNYSGTYLRTLNRLSISSTGAVIPVTNLHIDSGNATASSIKLTAGTTTGILSTDGFDIGITSGGVAEIRQRENLDLTIYTNNTLRWTWLAAGGATVPDAFNFALNTTTGTKIGTATTQKLGFYNATPVTQAAASVDLGTVLSNLGLRAAGTAFSITTSGAVALSGTKTLSGSNTTVTGGMTISTTALNITDVNVNLSATTGTKFGSGATQKLSFWNATPIVQPTTGVAAATFVVSAGTAVNDASTFDGYTIKQVVKALRNIGLLA